MSDKLNELFALQSELDNRIISERNINKSLDEWVVGITLAMESETLTPLPCLSNILNDIKTKLTRLEERTEENHRNVLTFSQMAESARSDASKAIGGVNALDEQLDLVREDIVYLDEKIDELKETIEGRNVTPITINIENLNVSGTESLKEFIERIAEGCGSGVM